MLLLVTKVSDGWACMTGSYNWYRTATIAPESVRNGSDKPMVCSLWEEGDES
jgi:hypothetical protein